jgi:hypothetical protein
MPSLSVPALDANLADVLAWFNDSPDATPEGYAPGWQSDAYEPTEADWSEYAGWSRMLDAGYPVDRLTPAEEDYYLGTLSQAEYLEVEAERDGILADLAALAEGGAR